MNLPYREGALGILLAMTIACNGGVRTGGSGTGNGSGRISCTSPEQCIGGECVDGACTAGSKGAAGAGCTSPVDCEGGLCNGGFCTEDPLLCLTDAQCDPGAYCHYASGPQVTKGICNAPCITESGCYPGQTCFEGRCYTLNECYTSGSEECVPGEVCDPVSNTCRWPNTNAVDFCALVGPATLNVTSAATVEVRGQIRELGVTDATSGADVSPSILAQWGFGPSGTTPGAFWSWSSASADPRWTDATNSGVDEYVSFIIAPRAGQYDHAFRFSVDGGASYTACDLDGSDNGYSAVLAGRLTTSAGACDPNPCTAPPASDCADETTRVDYEPLGTCALVDGGADCEHEATTFDCSSNGAVCLNG
ncbi:MAG: hypothetical protein AAF658_04125, partial [Myxococcota bacterium]